MEDRSSELPLKADMPELVRESESEGLRRWGFFAEDENGKRARKRHVESSAGGARARQRPLLKKRVLRGKRPR